MTIRQARRRYAHGTNARHHLGRCRCSPCRTAAKRYVELLRNDPERRLIPTTEAVAHIRFLQSQGMGIKTIARAAGITQSVLNRFVDAYRPIHRTRRRTARKILAVKPTAVKDGVSMRADDMLVLIDRLVDAGYRKGWIGKQLGAAYPVLQIAKGPWMQVGKARALHALYVRLSARDRHLPPIGPFKLAQIQPKHGSWKAAALPSISTTTAKTLYAHGTHSRYLIVGCRCKACAKAHALYTTAHRTRLQHQAFRLHHHQSTHLWTVWDVAREAVVFRSPSLAAALAMRNLFNSEDPHAGAHVLVDVAPAREHLRKLYATGISQKDIAHAANISRSHVHHLLFGRGTKTHAGTAGRLLAINPDVVHPSPLTLVEAQPIWKLLDRLVIVGFDFRWITLLLQTAFPQRRAMMQLRRAQAVQTLYARLEDRIPTLRELRVKEAG